MKAQSKSQAASSETIDEDLLIEAIDTLKKQRKRITRRLNYMIRYGKLTKRGICDVLEISRPTLDMRIENHEWTEDEIKKLLTHLK